MPLALGRGIVGSCNFSQRCGVSVRADFCDVEVTSYASGKPFVYTGSRKRIEIVNALEHFANNLVRLREEAEMSKDDLAIRAGLSLEEVEKAEAGAEGPAFEAIAQLAGGLGVPIAKLFEDVRGEDPDGR
jgi:DNA-binding XRE family transcriptional regulator